LPASIALEEAQTCRPHLIPDPSFALVAKKPMVEPLRRKFGLKVVVVLSRAVFNRRTAKRAYVHINT
jgi:hypothetical protein